MSDATFYGVDRGWMQAQWRDCRDKAAQLAIFRDMTDRKATVQEILDAVGEPEYCGPIGPRKRTYHSFTPEEDARIEQMANAGKTDVEIGDALGLEMVLRVDADQKPAQERRPDRA